MCLRVVTLMLQEIDALCEEWQPAPLVPDIDEEDQRPDPPVIKRWGQGLVQDRCFQHVTGMLLGTTQQRLVLQKAQQQQQQQANVEAAVKHQQDSKSSMTHAPVKQLSAQGAMVTALYRAAAVCMPTGCTMLF